MFTKTEKYTKMHHFHGEHSKIRHPKANPPRWPPGRSIAHHQLNPLPQLLLITLSTVLVYHISCYLC